MQFEWEEGKRKVNLKSHGLDFIDAPKVFGGPTFKHSKTIGSHAVNSGLFLSDCSGTYPLR
jgi:uncharacterized DUF497 family protein